MPPIETSASKRFIHAARAAMSRELGSEVPPGTTVAASSNREGLDTAVVHPLGSSTVVVCPPRLVSQLSVLDGGPALSAVAFVAAAGALGATSPKLGRSRVFEGAPSAPDLGLARVVALDRDRESDRTVIAAFIAECSQEDLDAAGLALDDLDPTILGVRSGDGALGALAFGRPWDHDDGFDDVGVMTAPSHRGQGLGRAAVAQLIHQQHQRGRLALYNCNVDNVGSDRLAVSLGFTLAQTIAQVRLT